MTDNPFAALLDGAVARGWCHEANAHKQMDPDLAQAITSEVLAALAAAVPGVPTEAQVASACLSYRHDFGLMDGPQREALMFEAREWLHAWRKEFAALAPSPARDVREAALKEAAAEIQRWWDDSRDNREPAPLILALIGEPRT